jgi:SecD/SecF fusion protein
MQGKGFIRVVAVLLIAISIYQLLFTWKANQIEKQAWELAISSIPAEDPAALFPNDPVSQFTYNDSIQRARVDFKNFYLDSLAPEKVFLWNTFRKVKENQLNLGLDLQGGMSAVLQVNIKELLISISDNNMNPAFRDALDLAESRLSESTDDYITLFAQAYKEKNPSGKLANLFATRSNLESIQGTSSDEEVLTYIRKESGDAIQRTYNIISTRIDQFGLKQPNVTLEPRKGRITVEMAGVDNPQRVRKMLQATASLEFWETYRANELGQSLNEANDALKAYIAYTKKGIVKPEETGTDTDVTSEAAKLLLEGDDDDVALSEAADLNNKDTAASKNDLEAFLQEAPLFALLNPAVDERNMYMETPVIGYVMNRDTAKLAAYLAVPEIKNKFPKDVVFMWGAKPVGEKNDFFELYAIQRRPNTDKPFIDGSAVENARPDLDQFGNVTISMRMTGEGARKWKKMTGDNVNRSIAIVVDNQVYSAPNVTEEISGGSSQITGRFTQQEAQDLSNILKIGKLPASANIVEEETVGATLGAESVRAGMLSMLAGLILVVAFMIFFYNTAGLAANIVLLLNLFLIIGILATYGATLTLPGIAGIVLTMGMAVDANVIIFERIKEELRLGKTMVTAIADGFKNSYSAILDGNITTFITGAILLYVGLGPVKGFATTLIIGILTTLFTAVLLSRVIIESFTSKDGKKFAVSNSFSENFLQNIHFDFIGKRKIAYLISTTFIVVGIASFFARGFEYGVDFKGGREYKVRFEQPVQTDAIRAELDKVLGSGTIVKSIGAANQVKITTSYKIDQMGMDVDNEVDQTIYEGLGSFLSEGTSFETFKDVFLLSRQKVDPTISVDIKQSSFWATILSILAVFVYILIRFRSWSYSVGAIAATAHDAFFLLAAFSLLHGFLPFSMEINQTFIAALLTVIGYSLNDTVVIFDRLREYLGVDTDKKQRLSGVMNNAINSTLSRTFATSITTLFTILILFVFGGDVLRAFSFAMIIGVLVGTYSSVFIASPIMYDLTKGRRPDVAPEKKAQPVVKEVK